MNPNRIGLLTALVLVGMGLAVCLGALANTSPKTVPGKSKSTALGSSAPESAVPSPVDARADEPSEEDSPPSEPGNRPGSRSLTETLAAPGPVWAPSHPAVTYQIMPPDDSPLLKLLESLKERLDANDAGSRATTAGESGAASEPTVAAPPAPVPSEAPEAAETAAAAPPKPMGTVDALGNQRFEIHFQNDDIRQVLEAISEHAGLNTIVSDSVQGTVTANFVDVDALEALDAILKSTGFLARREGAFMYVGTPDDFLAMEQTLDQIATRIYRPQYVTATELQNLITPLVSKDIGDLTISSEADVGIGGDNSNVGGDAYAGEDVLLVRDYSTVLTEIDQIVAEVDVRPVQVAIEAMILSIKLNDETKMGFSFEFLRDNPNVRFGISAPLDTLPETLAGGGLQFAFLDSNLGAFVDAVESIQDTNVIATPRVLVLNKHRAEVQIGKELGYITSTITETSTAQNVEYLKTGTILQIRPFISSDGVIRMELHPELSGGEIVEKGGSAIPQKDTTQVTTNVMVRDGCTVIIGGLIREQLNSGATQVPLFGSLPLVGPLFRTNNNQSTFREEILILLTPHIVREPDMCEEGKYPACEFHRRRDVMAEKATPLSRDHMSNRYFRLAQNAWATGDRQRALRFAELAVHFHPGNRAAIDLRSDIWMNQSRSGHALVAPDAMPQEPAVNLDGEALPSWVLEGLREEEFESPRPAAKRGEGTPSKSITKPGGWR